MRNVADHENHVRWVYLTTVLCMGECQKYARNIRERPLDFQGGGPGFFSLARIFFSVTFRAKIFFFNLSWARIFFSQAILGQNIFFYTIQIWKQLFSWAANRLENYYIEVVCCLSVCVSDRDDFKWHKIANSKYIAIQLYMRVYTLMLVAIEIWHSELSRITVFAAKRHSVYPKSCQWYFRHPQIRWSAISPWIIFSIEEYICLVNMAHMVKSGQLRANMTK